MHCRSEQVRGLVSQMVALGAELHVARFLRLDCGSGAAAANSTLSSSAEHDEMLAAQQVFECWKRSAASAAEIRFAGKPALSV